MAEKTTTMELKVDLQCEKCIKKLKKTLSKFPQIRDQVFNEKQNIVTIKVVVCCQPEKIRDKICSKGGGAIQSIKIVEDKKKSDEPKQGEKKKADEPKQEPKKNVEEPEKKTKQKEEPRSESPSREMPKTKAMPHIKFADPLVKELGPNSPVSKSAGATAALITVPEYTSLVAVPFGMSCVPPYYEGGSGGPWFHGYYGSQSPYPPPVYYDEYYGKDVYDSYGGGGGRTRYVNRYDKYDEGEGAASECTTM